MTAQTNRIIWSNNGTLTDLSVTLNNYISGTQVIDFVALQDKLYIGSELPFNHRWFEPSVVNAVAATWTVEVWGGTAWVPAVDVLDETAIAGATLAKAGVISWKPDKNGSGWQKNDTNLMGTPSGLSALNIYDLYWTRWTASANLTGTTALKAIAHRFSRDEDLEAKYPRLGLTTTKNRFKSGKTDWNDQHFAAAEAVVRSLKSKRMADSENQILDWQMFVEPAVHYVAAIAWREFGEDFTDDLAESMKQFEIAMNVIKKRLDYNRNARLDEIENIQHARFVRR